LFLPPLLKRTSVTERDSLVFRSIRFREWTSPMKMGAVAGFSGESPVRMTFICKLRGRVMAPR
jgi:hypothetical protein